MWCAQPTRNLRTEVRPLREVTEEGENVEDGTRVFMDQPDGSIYLNVIDITFCLAKETDLKS